MATPVSVSQAEIVEIVQSLKGGEIAKMMTFGLFCLTIYEYMITLDEEMKYFWTGRWTLSRTLFLTNRYLVPVIMTLSIVCYSAPNPTPEFCKPAIQAAFFMSIMAITVVQAILVTRIWYLFQGSKSIQFGIISVFLASFIFSLFFTYVSAKELEVFPSEEFNKLFPGVRNEGCRAAVSPNFWRVFLPSLILHTVLYVLTALRALKNRQLLKDAPVLKRLFRDGGFFYLVVFVSVSYTAIGSFLKNYPLVNIPAIYSNFLLTTTSIAVSRVMFSIHSLADKLGSDSSWLLNNVELSRVRWRRGAHEAEIIIGDDVAYGDDDLESIRSAADGIVSFKLTRLGGA